MENDTDHSNSVYSICITYKNVIKTVENSLTSILSQLDDRFEVIVVDGGSTDGTVEVVRRLQSKYGRLILVCHPCSRGLGREIAYRLSKGKYLIQGGDGDKIFRPTLQLILDHYHSNEKVFDRYALFIPGTFLVCTRDIMDSVGGWPNLQFAEDAYILGKLTRVCTVEHNRSLWDVAVKEHVKSAGSSLEYGYIIWRDFHRYLPFAQTIEVLRNHLREVPGRWLPMKIGTIALFFLGALGQYSMVRYKLCGQDLQSYLRVTRFVMAAEKSLESKGIAYDLIFDRTNVVSPRVLRRGPTNLCSRA